jgi:hypothetical protein
MSGRAGLPVQPIVGDYSEEFYEGRPDLIEIAPPFPQHEFDPGAHRPPFPSEDNPQAGGWPTQPIHIVNTARQDLRHANGTAVDVQIGMSSSFADKKYIDERPVTGYSRVPPVQDVPVLRALPSYVGAGPTPVGGVVCGLKIETGADGSAIDFIMNQCPGQTHKVPLVAARTRLSGTLLPKFYAFDDVTFANTRIYLNPGEPAGAAHQLTNDRFSRPMTNDVLIVDGPNLVSQGFGEARVQYKGFLAEGSLSTDTLGKVTRRFFGTIPAGGVGAFKVIVPIPENTTDVILMGGGVTPGLNFTQRPAVAAIQFAGYAAPFTELGPFTEGIIVPLVDDAVDIIVRSGAILTVETQFELIFFISA